MRAKRGTRVSKKKKTVVFINCSRLMKKPEGSSRRGRFTSGEAEGSATKAVSRAWASSSSPGMGIVGSWGASCSRSWSLRLWSEGGDAATSSSAIGLNQIWHLRNEKEREMSLTIVDPSGEGNYRSAALLRNFYVAVLVGFYRPQ